MDDHKLLEEANSTVLVKIVSTELQSVLKPNDVLFSRAIVGSVSK